MSHSSGIGFGGVLLGFGLGWLIIKYIGVSWDVAPYLLILAGIGIVLFNLLFRKENRRIGELTGGLIGGLFIAVVLSSVFGLTGILPFGPSMSGSGNIIDREFDLQGFTVVNAGNGFHVEIVQGFEYRISVSLDDNMLDRLVVQKDGDKLKIGIKPGSYTNLNLNAVITTPILNGVELSGGSHGDVSGFSSTNDFSVVLSDGSEIVIVGSAGDLRVDASDGSRVDLSRFKVDYAKVVFSDGSNGSVYADEKLDVDLSDGSHLDYYGDPVLGNIDLSDGSTISPK
jgi:hypothetical protein